MPVAHTSVITSTKLTHAEYTQWPKPKCGTTKCPVCRTSHKSGTAYAMLCYVLAGPQVAPWILAGVHLGVMGLLQLRFEHDSSTIRARFEHDTSTTRYNTLRGFSCARIRHRFEHSTRISGRRVLHVD